MTEGPTSADWSREATVYLADAQTLAARHSWRNAYMSAGFALECTLKARIMRVSGMNRWPARGDRPELFTHNLAALAFHAGLAAAIQAETTVKTDLGALWLIAKDFDVNLRYPDGSPFPVKLGRDMLAAAEALMPWLTKTR